MVIETSGNVASVVRVGNEITGAFDFEETSSLTASLHHEGSNDLGTFTLDHANSTTITAVGWGNDIVGDYSIESEASDVYAWTQTNDGGVSYSLHAEGVNVRQRMAVGNDITQDYIVDEVGSDAFTLQQLATTDVSIDAEEVYTLTEQGNQASGLFAREVTSTLTFERWIDAVDDAGTVSYSLEAAGDFLVGSLSLTETGDTRYSLLEAFNNTASGQNGAAPSNVDYSSFGAGFNINETAELPTGGMSSPTGGAEVFARRGSALTSVVGSQAANIDASTGAVGIAEWQTGRELIGAATIDKYASYGAELFKTFCFADDTPLRTPDGSKLIRDFRKGDAILAALDSDPLAPVGVQFIEEIFSNHSPILNLHAAGRIIRTTAEHPIFAWGRGWVPAGSLRAGDQLRSDNGSIVRVEGVAYSGEAADVYNLKVGEFHTYFVGEADWGWSIWAHNTTPTGDCGGGVESGAKVPTGGEPAKSDGAGAEGNKSEPTDGVSSDGNPTGDPVPVDVPAEEQGSDPVQPLEVGTYGDMKDREVVGDGTEHHEIPSKAAILKAKEKELKRELDDDEKRELQAGNVAIELPRKLHQQQRTSGGKNRGEQSNDDADDLGYALTQDLMSLVETMRTAGYSEKEIQKAVASIIALNKEKGIVPGGIG